MKNTIISRILPLISLIGLSTIATATVPYVSKTLPLPQSTQAKQRISGFNAITVDGNIHLILENTHARQPRVIINRSHKDRVYALVRHHRLYLHPTDLTHLHTQPTVIVKIQHLRSLTVNNAASVTGKNFRSKSLVIRANSRGHINLHGMLNVTRIWAGGSGRIQLGWINSPIVSIYAVGGSHIILAGVAKQIRAIAKNNAVINAEYLRTQNIMVKTTDRATAKVLPVNTLRAFAQNSSNIYFYKRPINLTRDSEQSGSILQFAWRD